MSESHRKIVRENSVPFDEISIPSRGIFYEDKKETFLVKYITAKEENLLTSPTLIDSGRALEMLMSSSLLDWEGDIDKLLIGDRDAFMVYLRSTSYGDKISFTIKCSNCQVESESSFNLSGLEMKEIKDMPDENLEYTFVMPTMKIKGESVVIKFKPKTLADERRIIKTVEKEARKIGDLKLENRIEVTYRNQITSINGVRDVGLIKRVIKSMPLGDSAKLRAYMDEVEPGVDNTVRTACNSCGHIIENKIPIDTNFFGLNPEYRQHMMDEVFLITYYGKGGFSRDDVFNMPVYERRWVMQRIQEEVEKKNAADRQASNKARSQAKSK